MHDVSGLVVGVSFKAYFDRDRTRRWCAEVAAGARESAAVQGGDVRVFVLPSVVHLGEAVRAFAGTPVGVGAQDTSIHPTGAFTGEVPAADLAGAGARYVAVGHAERRRLFGETDGVVAAKAAAAVRAGLVPVVCVGEPTHVTPEAAAGSTLAQLDAALAGVPAGPVVVAYEPVWAIGAPRPAPLGHIAEVTRALSTRLRAAPEHAGSSVVYGGSAGPGLLTGLAGDADGLFLGRFAHDPDDFLSVIDEAAALTGRRAA